MALPIVWSTRASRNLSHMLDVIADGSETAAVRMRTLIQESVERLAEHPFLYRRGRISGTREMVVHPNYIVVYRVTSERVEIIDMLHSRRHYP